METTYSPSVAATLSVGLNHRSFRMSLMGLDVSCSLMHMPTSPFRAAGKFHTAPSASSTNESLGVYPIRITLRCGLSG